MQSIAWHFHGAIRQIGSLALIAWTTVPVFKQHAVPD
jgi:hypothetical protein